MAHNFGFRRPGEPQHPSLSTLAPGNVPTGVEAFPWCYCSMTLHFLKPMLRSSSYLRSVLYSIAHWFNTVVFLRMALRHATRTLFSFQGTTKIIPYL
jgi:hypothetical protein